MITRSQFVFTPPGLTMRAPLNLPWSRPHPSTLDILTLTDPDPLSKLVTNDGSSTLKLISVAAPAVSDYEEGGCCSSTS
jgi:hypothetical protein